jgi:hypothetical protein
VPVSWLIVGEVVAETVAVTQPVADEYTWLLKGTHSVPFHQVSDWPPVPNWHTVMVTDPKALSGFNATS